LNFTVLKTLYFPTVMPLLASPEWLELAAIGAGYGVDATVRAGTARMG
jgi:hypothetical protein